MGQPNEIYDKYLTRAISEINDLTGEMLRCRLCSHSKSMPVIGSGHPLADIMLLKYRVQPSELHEGVAFFGRAGTAIMKSCQRLGIDPLQLYGTNVLKCGSVRDEAKAEARCLEYLRREIAIVEPKLIVAMGDKVVAALDRLALPTARPSSARSARSSSSRRGPTCWSPPTSTRRSTSSASRPPSGRPSAASASGTRRSPHTDARMSSQPARRRSRRWRPHAAASRLSPSRWSSGLLPAFAFRADVIVSMAIGVALVGVMVGAVVRGPPAPRDALRGRRRTRLRRGRRRPGVVPLADLGKIALGAGAGYWLGSPSPS